MGSPQTDERCRDDRDRRRDDSKSNKDPGIQICERRRDMKKDIKVIVHFSPGYEERFVKACVEVIQRRERELKKDTA